MQRITGVKTAVLIGVLVYQISSIKIPSRSSDCFATMEISMSDFCRSEETFLGDICNPTDGSCQIKGSKVCNMTIHFILDQYPALRGCMYAWEDPCTSIQLLVSKCHSEPVVCALIRGVCHWISNLTNNLRIRGNWSISSGPQDIEVVTYKGKCTVQPKKASVVDWQASSLIDHVHDTDGSCLQQMTICIHDEVCNRQLVSLVQACSAKQCNSSQCRQVTQKFYNGLPYNVAEMFVICDCDPGDQDCLHMKEGLHSGTCGEHLEETRTCLELFDNCLEEVLCRNRFKALLSKCWDSEYTPCRDYPTNDCTSLMDPALIHGRDIECRKALMATMGTSLQLPCTCEGVHTKDLLKCNMLHQSLHNRSHFMSPLKKVSVPYQPPQVSESGPGDQWLSDQLLYVFAYVLLVVVVLLAVMIVFHKLGMHRGTEKPQFHPPDKSAVVNF